MKLKYYSGAQVMSIIEKLPSKEYLEILNAFAEEPSADVRENVHAHWEGDGQCSNCKDYPLARYMRNPNFCPNCGAQMDERKEDGEIHKS